MKTILASAYAINPYKGSEDGMGWNFVMQIARFNKVVAITRENNRQHIEKYMSENPDEVYQNVEFQYYDLPLWMRFWKKGSRGAMLYYLLWQRGIVAFIRERKIVFDIAHNLNFHNDWTPSFLWKLNKPFVWGPVGHHPLIPAQYLEISSKSWYIKDRLTWGIKKYFWNFSRDLRLTRQNAAHIFCMNNGVPETLKLKDNYSVSPSVATQDFGWDESVPINGTFTVISAGRFVPLKGFDLTIFSFASFLMLLNEKEKANCELVLVGSGPQEAFLKNIVKELKIEDHVKFISWMGRDALMKMFREASVFLFPSHEGAGMVVAEALSFGLPVVCLDNEGPGQFINNHCGYAVPQGTYEATVAGLAEAIHKIYNNPEEKLMMRKAARKQFKTLFCWDRRGEQLQNIYAGL
jgi:glycosyltransferase involved in cell wall biosynthesis